MRAAAQTWTAARRAGRRCQLAEEELGVRAIVCGLVREKANMAAAAGCTGGDLRREKVKLALVAHVGLARRLLHFWGVFAFTCVADT